MLSSAQFLFLGVWREWRSSMADVEKLDLSRGDMLDTDCWKREGGGWGDDYSPILDSRK